MQSSVESPFAIDLPSSSTLQTFDQLCNRFFELQSGSTLDEREQFIYDFKQFQARIECEHSES
jgi:hypothetical protein